MNGATRKDVAQLREELSSKIEEFGNTKSDFNSKNKVVAGLDEISLERLSKIEQEISTLNMEFSKLRNEAKSTDLTARITSLEAKAVDIQRELKVLGKNIPAFANATKTAKAPNPSSTALISQDGNIAFEYVGISDSPDFSSLPMLKLRISNQTNEGKEVCLIYNKLTATSDAGNSIYDGGRERIFFAGKSYSEKACEIVPPLVTVAAGLGLGKGDNDKAIQYLRFEFDKNAVLELRDVSY